MYRQAINGYNIFLKNYPDDIYSNEVREYLGDIYYKLNKYNSSGSQYYSIVKNGKERAIIFDLTGKNKINIHKRVSLKMLDSFALNLMPEYKKIRKRKPNFLEKKGPTKVSYKIYFGL